LTDQLGSMRAQTNSSGTVTATASYDAWGNSIGTTGSVTTPFSCAGASVDASNGLSYLRARWYDKKTGQGMHLDPQFATTLDPYQYAKNDPENRLDPTGLDALSNLLNQWAEDDLANAEYGLILAEEWYMDDMKNGGHNQALFEDTISEDHD